MSTAEAVSLPPFAVLAASRGLRLQRGSCYDQGFSQLLLVFTPFFAIFFLAMPEFLTAALYKFVPLPDFAALQAPLQAFCESQDVRGTLLLAEEGINGTIAGPADGVRVVVVEPHESPDRGWWHRR